MSGGDEELERRLRELGAPDEAEAQQRAWNVIRAAQPIGDAPVPPSMRRRALVLGAAAVAALAIGLSPAGAKVGELVSDVLSTNQGAPDARPALRSLPAAGELLVQSESGPWVVREDGGKRLLGDYDTASWSPHGLFVIAAAGRELTAVDPAGNVRWTLAAPGEVADLRWAPSGFRIAYRSGDDLRVVAGDGSGDRLLARAVAPMAPAWRAIGDAKLAAQPGMPGANVLTYAEKGGRLRTVDVDSGERLPTTPTDARPLDLSHGDAVRRAVSADGSRVATLKRNGPRDQLVVREVASDRRQVLFATRGVLTGPTWSPDGRWLLIGWPSADQWLYIPAGGIGDRRARDRLVAFDRVSQQFDPGGDGSAPFPEISGWVLPQR